LNSGTTNSLIQNSWAYILAEWTNAASISEVASHTTDWWGSWTAC